MKKNIDAQFLCKDCTRYNLCEYYHRRRKDSYICKYFHLSVTPQEPQESNVEDVQPVIYAKWIIRGGKVRCSNCDALSPLTKSWEDGCSTYTHSKTKFCSECGAMMVEPQESEDKE